MNLNVEEIVKQYLIEHGYDGLCNDDGDCGCSLDDFNPCGELTCYCVAAYNHGTKDDFIMMTRKPEVKK